MKKIFIIVILFVVIVSIGFAVLSVNKEDKLNVLLYGVDGRKEKDETERSDAIILVNVNLNTSKMTITSIPRDSYVEITCKNNEYDKINHAYAYGGQKCLNETVSKLFEINDLKNAILKFDDVIKIVDFFGLIELTPKYTFCQSDEKLENKYCFEKNKTILVDGKQALAYMRNRKSLPNGDISRTENQRQIFQIIIKKFFNLNLIGKVKFYNFLKENIKTDIKLTDFNFKKIINVKQLQLNEYTLRGEDYINVYYYYKLDTSYLEKIKKYYV